MNNFPLGGIGAGPPVAPSSITVANVEVVDIATAAIAFALPNPDVAAGYRYSLAILPGNGASSLVTSEPTNGVTTFDVDRPAIMAASNKLSVSLNLGSKFCSGVLCGRGMYRLTSLAAASYWTTSSGTTPIDLALPWAGQSHMMTSAPDLASEGNELYFYVGAHGRHAAVVGRRWCPVGGAGCSLPVAGVVARCFS